MFAASLPSFVVWIALTLGVLLWFLGIALHYRQAFQAPGFLALAEPQRRRFKAGVIALGSLVTGLILIEVASSVGLLRFHMPEIGFGGFSLVWLALLAVNFALYEKYRRDPRAALLLLWQLGTLALIAVFVAGVSASMPWQVLVGAAIAYIVLREFCYVQLKRGESSTGQADGPAMHQ